MANEKSKAEQYCDERKARIAEAAKKNAKNMEKKNTAKKQALFFRKKEWKLSMCYSF